VFLSPKEKGHPLYFAHFTSQSKWVSFFMGVFMGVLFYIHRMQPLSPILGGLSIALSASSGQPATNCAVGIGRVVLITLVNIFIPTAHANQL
jgi:hypothetical protein